MGAQRRSALERNRTSDTFFRREVLYPLSYQGRLHPRVPSNESSALGAADASSRREKCRASCPGIGPKTQQGRDPKVAPLLLESY